MRLTLLSLLGLLLVALVAPVSAHQATYYGNNSWTRHRLPWQHGSSFGFTQGYNQGNHNNSVNRYSLDFAMDPDSPLLAITQGAACQVLEPNTTGLGRYVVQTAPGSWANRSGTDYYFYGHTNYSYVETCDTGTTYLYQGQIGAWSGCSGTCEGPSLHTSVLNPGSTCYCGSEE